MKNRKKELLFCPMLIKVEVNFVLDKLGDILLYGDMPMK